MWLTQICRVCLASWLSFVFLCIFCLLELTSRTSRKIPLPPVGLMRCLIQILFASLTCPLFGHRFAFLFSLHSLLRSCLLSPAHPCLASVTLFIFLYLCTRYSFILHSPPLWACLSSCRAARHKDTVMLSLLGWHNSTSLWGVKALTLACLSVCAAPLPAPVNPSWLSGWYLSSRLPPCLPVQQVVGVSRVVISGCI